MEQHSKITTTKEHYKTGMNSKQIHKPIHFLYYLMDVIVHFSYLFIYLFLEINKLSFSCVFQFHSLES